jgi:hypothetical protein
MDHDILMGDYRFRWMNGNPVEYHCDWLLGGVCISRSGKTWRAYMSQRPSPYTEVRDGTKPVRFRTPAAAARYLVEAITERKLPRSAA